MGHIPRGMDQHEMHCELSVQTGRGACLMDGLGEKTSGHPLGSVLSDVQRGTGIACAGEEVLGQGEILTTGLLDLALTRCALVRVFGAGALQALQAPIEPLELAQVVLALAPVAQAFVPAQLRTGLDGLAHGIQEQVEVGGVMHVGLDDKGVSARVEPFLGAFFYQLVPGTHDHLVDAIEDLGGANRRRFSLSVCRL